MAEYEPSLLKLAARSIHYFKSMGHDMVQLIGLEAQLFGKSLGKVVAFSVLLFVLAITIWLLLMAVFAVGLKFLGIHWLLSLLIVILFNGVLAFALIYYLRKTLPKMKFATTRRILRKNYEKE